VRGKWPGSNENILTPQLSRSIFGHVENYIFLD